MKNNITPELVRAALTHIPANLPRDEWVRIGMALRSEYPGDEGFALFDEWSATSESYSAKATRSTWRSIKAAGGVTVATLLHEAKARGFNVQASAQDETVQTDAQRTRERARRAQIEEGRRQAAQVRAAAEAAELWSAASDEGISPYLARKGVQPYGVRFTPDGWLLVPVRDEAGQLHNLQRIAPGAAAGDPDKLFLAGGRKSGLWHMLGDPAGAAVLLVAEGYATAASLHQATARPVATAFDAGNLQHVARALRKLHPAALLVLCGDDDTATQARTGTNAGRVKATAAARAVRGLAVFPEGLPDGGSDFNDLHQHLGGAAGLEAVRSIVQAAIDARHAQDAKARRPGAQAGEAAALDVFDVQDSGVWFVGVEQDGKRRHPEWVCSRLDVAARTRDQDGAGWGYLLQFADPLGTPKQWAMPARMLSGDGGEYRASLLNMGLRIAASPKARNLLTQYIQTRAPAEFAQCTERGGWHGTAFVLPRETLGDQEERIVFQTDTAIENTFKVKGTAEQWRDRVGALCAGNSRLVFSVSCAFAGPLLRPAGMESGGFHWRGDSSSGKTTALKIAASVYGGESFVQRWRATANSIEGMAAQHSDVTLILDELSQVDAKEAGEVAYMLANGQGKGRATRTGLPRARLAWRLLFLSSGELGLADHMAEGMKRTRTGQEVRMADIPVDAGAGMGAFENLHGREGGGAAFARHITREALACYGAPGRAFIEWACTHADTLSRRVREAQAALAGQMVPEAASGQVERVGARFALVGVAGELATEAGLTGWAKGESERAARACFNAWLESRGGIGNGEVVAMLRAVRRFLEVHGAGRFSWWHRAASDRVAVTVQRAGYRRMLNKDGEPIKTDSQHGTEYGDYMPASRGDEVSVEYFILPEVFRSEVCNGFDYQAVARVLRDHECLLADKGRFDCSARLPGLGPSKAYRIPPKIFELDL
jgi:putative DNA primase/helicase